MSLLCVVGLSMIKMLLHYAHVDAPCSMCLLHMYSVLLHMYNFQICKLQVV